VVVYVVARYEGLEARAHTAFLPWW
jgi:hypothetical protein